MSITRLKMSGVIEGPAQTFLQNTSFLILHSYVIALYFLVPSAPIKRLGKQTFISKAESL